MKTRELLVATGNEGKLRELRGMLADLPLALAGLSDFPQIRAVPETGATFDENASLKASGYARQTGMLTLADDSGLEVEVLHGAPGVLSARYLSEEASYADRISALLSEIKNARTGDPRARFVCVVAIADKRGEILHISRGMCEGKIAQAPSGSGGFGYDPIFVPDGFDQTFAELSAGIKNKVSHRARALAKAHEFLARLTRG